MRKNVIITGHASGIGLYVARMFHNEGFNVIGLDKDRTCELPESTTQIQCNLSCWEEVESVFSGIHNLNYAVNCAGVPGTRKTVKDITSQEMTDAYNAIFMPAFHACKAEISCMQRSEGISKIINIASVTASFGSKEMIAYSSAKAAIVNLTKVCAVENAPRILINAISPATIDTPMIRRKYNEQLPDYTAAYLTESCGSTHDVWTAVKFLIDNNFMTGSDLVMDGGYSSAFALQLKQKAIL